MTTQPPIRLIAVVQIDDVEQLRQFREHLVRIGVRHYVSKDEPGLLLVESAVDRAIVLEQLDQLSVDSTSRPVIRLGPLAPLIVRAPVTGVLLLLMLASWPLTMGFEHGDFGAFFYAFTFTNEVAIAGNLYKAGIPEIIGGQYWRLFTPVFLHFGVAHLVFNMLGVFVVGSRLEPRVSSTLIVILCLFAALVSNVSQFVLGSPAYFGGMSGVFLALIGCAFVWQLLRPGTEIGLPRAFYWLCIAVTFLGFTGMLDALAGARIANWSHLGGLLSGMLVGLVSASGAAIFRR